MKQFSVLFLIVLMACMNLFAQEPPPACSVTGSGGAEIIEEFNFNNNSLYYYCNYDECGAFYYINDASIATMKAGETYSFSGKTGLWYNVYYNHYVRIFLDFNKDGDFSDLNELVWTTGNGTVYKNFNGSFTIPENTAPGQYRFRVVTGEENNSQGLISGCGNMGYYSHAVDFIANVIPNENLVIENVPSVCLNKNFEISYLASGFDQNNTFLVELSDANGSFDNPTVISEELESTTSGIIEIAIPNNLVENGTYYIRMLASNPEKVSSPVLLNILNKIAPIIQAKSIIFSNVMSNSIRVKWTNGNGESRIVLAKEGTSITETPIEGIAYSANSQYGLGDTIGGAIVVYSGTGNFVNVTGLNPNTNYTFKVFEFNNTGQCVKYATNNASMNPRTRKTAMAQPVIVTNNNKGTHFFLAKWTYEGLVQYFEIDVSQNSLFTSFITGWQTADVGDINEIIVDGLNPNFTYYYRVRAVDNNGAVSSWSNTTMIRTLQNPPTGPATNAFVTNRAPSSFTLNWTNGGERAIVLLSTSPVNATLENGIRYTANSNYGANQNTVGNAKVVLFGGVVQTSVNITGLDPNTTYHYAIYSYNGLSEGSENYHGTALTGNTITLSSEPTIAPSNVTFTETSKNSTTVNWTPGNGQKSIVIAKQGVDNEGGSMPTGYCTPSILYSSYSFGLTNINNGGINHSHSGFYPTGYSNQTANFQTSVTRGQAVNFSLSGGANINYSIWVDWNRDGDFGDANERVAFSNLNSGQGSSYVYSGNFVVPSNALSGSTRIRVHANYYYYNSSFFGNESTPCSTFSNLYGEYVDYRINVISNPVDGNSYIANNAFGAGSQIGEWSIVYQGSENSANVNNLNPNSFYSFRVYTFNGENASENYLNNPATGSVTTQANSPTVAPSNMNFSNIGATNMNVNWTPGNGENTIILASTNNVFTAPSNNTEYVANTDFTSESSSVVGNAKVVYSGSGSSFNLSGLNPNTTYYFAAYAYNGSGANSAFLTTPANGNESTLFVTPTQEPSNVNFTNNNTTSFTINWTPGNGSNSLVVLYEGNANLDFADPQNTISYVASSDFGGNGSAIGSGKVVHNGTGSSVNVSGLNPGTMYYAWVYTFNGNGNKTNYLTEVVYEWNQTLLAASKLVITGISPTSNLASGQSFSITVEAQDVNNNPAFPLNNTTVKITFVGDSTLSGTLSRTINSNQTSVTFTNLVYNNKNGEFGVDFTASDNASILTQGTLNNVNFIGAEPTTQERVLMFGGIGQTQMTVTWTKGNGSNRILVARAGAEIEDLPVDGEEYTANSIYGDEDSELGSGYVVYNGTEKSVTVTGLTSGTTYHFKAFSYNGSGSNTNYITNDASLNPRSKATLGKEGDYAGGTDETLCDVIGNSLNISEITPNPTSDEIKFTMSNGLASIGSIVILNSAGQEVQQILNNGVMPEGQSNYSIDVSNLPAGMYLLYSQVGECVAVQKFIINR